MTGSGGENMKAPQPEASPVRRDLALTGILLIVGSTFILSSADILVKYLAVHLPPVQVVWLRFMTMGALMIPVLAFAGGRHLARSGKPFLQIVRGCGLAGSALFFVTGLQYLQLAEATAMSFIAPVFVTALSAVILREQVGIRRWGAALVGLLGVLIIVRPGTEAFQLAALLPVGSAICWASTLIITRLLGQSEHPATTLAWSSWVCLALTSIALPFFLVPVTPVQVVMAVVVGVLSAAGQYMVIAGFRYADASLLAPFSYLLVIWSTLGSFVFYGEVPGIWTFAGGVLIVGSGVYTAHRERKRAIRSVPAVESK